LKKEKANFVFCGSPSLRGESGADEVCSRPRGREIQHAERSAFFVRITTLSEREISFQITTRSVREISICFENRFGFGKIKAPE